MHNSEMVQPAAAAAGEGSAVAEIVLGMTTTIVSSAINARLVPNMDQLPDLIGKVHAALTGISKPGAAAVPLAQTPAVNPKKSVTDDFIICLEDGKKFKSLKRHLMSHYGLTPDQYREKWGLEASYPMVAPNYAATRSLLAKKLGLGKKPANRLAA